MNYAFKMMAVVLALGVLVLGGGASADNKCGKIKIAEMSWATAELFANIDKIILEEKFGCEVELISGATMPTFNSMKNENGPDIAPEMWVNGVINPLNKAVKDKKIFIANSEPIPKLGEGWWVSPAVLLKYPELKTIFDIIKRPDLFPHSEDKTKGAFIGCPSGWACQLANNNLFRAFEMEKKGWVLVDPGTGAGLDRSISKTIERGQNWFGYYWAPTSMVGKYNLKRVNFATPFAGKMNWDGCIVKLIKDCPNPQKTAWVKSEVLTLTNKKIINNYPNIFKYLSNRIIPVSIVNQMLVVMAEQQLSGKDAAIYFFDTYKPIMLSWFENNNKNRYVNSTPKTQTYTKSKPTISSAELDESKRAAQNERQKRIELERKLASLQSKQKQEQQRIDTDNQEPIINAFTKQNGSNATISGRVTDNTEVAEVLINGQAQQLSSNGTFETKFYIPRTGKTIEIVAFDTKGNKASKLLKIERGNIQQASGPIFDALNPSGKTVKSNSNALALIIGVADYSKTNANALYADKDAQQFYDYATMKLGIPSSNIKELVNAKADRVEITLAVKDWIARSTESGKTDIYVFFAGHGLSTADGKDMFLLPYDGLPRLLQDSAIKRDQLFADIQKANPKSVTVFLDTCYSGTTRGTDMLIASRPIAIRALKQSIPNNFTVFSAAAGDQTSKPLEEAKHGMFSYFLMKGMEGDADTNSDNKITAQELHNYVKENVTQQSSGSQTPELQGNKDRVLVQFN